MRAFPPKGYFGTEWALPHNFGYTGSLSAFGLTKDTTMFPILLNDDARNPDGEQVNPKNSNFGEIANGHCSPESIVEKVSVTLQLALSKGAIETDKVRALKVNYMPIYTAFENRLLAEDIRSTDTIMDILRLEKTTATHEVNPNYSGTKLGNGSAAPNSDLGLTTNQNMESIVFDQEKFYDAIQYYTNGSMLKQITGFMKTLTLTRDRPATVRLIGNNQPIVKTINPYTFCGLLINVPQSNQSFMNQYGFQSEMSAIDHVHFKCQIRYNEWNKEFDQAAN